LKLTNVLITHPDIKQVVGFSAGAAAIYKSMFDHSSNNINLILFYPSQIRHFLNNHPSSPCHIIFPKSEPHFSLPDVIKRLKQQSNIRIEQNTYQHGFMNKTSKAFNQNAYNHYCQMLKVLLAKKSNNTPIK
jgi:hypothetical protein